MPNRREFEHVLGRIFADRVFGDKFLINPEDALKLAGHHLTEHEVQRLSKLSHMDIQKVRMVLGPT